MKKAKNIMKIIALILVILYVLAGFEEPAAFSILFVESFVTAFYYAGVYTNLAKIINESEEEDIRSILLYGHTILILTSVFTTITIFVIDILLVIPLIIMVAILYNSNVRLNIGDLSNKITIKCDKCGTVASIGDIFCTNCGAKLDENLLKNSSKIVKPIDFDPIYSNSTEVLLEKFIERELSKAGLEEPKSLIPKDIVKRKNILTILLSVLIALCVCLIFFHFPVYTYVFGLIIITVFIVKTRKYNFMTYLKKEIKSRPQEKISNIIMNIKASLIEDKQKTFRVIAILIGIIIPLIVFSKPRIMYEKVEGGYAVRFYTFGLTNFKTAEIPEKHNGEPVISLRGNTFSNMFFLEEVSLPDTIKEIRGQAFKNDVALRYVNIPSKIEYLGGGAFYGCSSITKIELPDTLTFLGGESFYNAESLKEIKLSENLTEIRGNTFENCSSLETITIPDKVERIGGHAFYGNKSLKEAIFTENSQLKEIGSSAFRLCNNLRTITIPKNTSVNERAFKESPTKVKRFGDIDFENIVDKNNYNNYGYIYFQSIGENQIVNKYITDAIIKQTTLVLVEARQTDNYYQYTLKYIDELGETTFTLDKDNLYKEINKNLVFSIGSEYALTSYNGGLGVNAYYN